AVSDLDIVVAATRERIIMLEAGAKQVPEAKVVEAIEFAHQQMQPLFDIQEKLAAENKKPVEQTIDMEVDGQEVHVAVKSHLGQRLMEAAKELDRAKRQELLKQ